MEFFAVLGIAIFFLIFLHSYAAQRSYETMQEVYVKEAGALAREAANAINAVAYSEGSSADILLPASIGGASFNATVYSSAFLIELNGATVMEPLRTRALRNETSAAPFRLASGEYYATNSGGTVVIARK